MRHLAIAVAAAAIVGGLIPVVPARSAASKFDTRTAPFSISFNGETSAYEDMSTFVRPNARLTIKVVGAPARGKYTLKTLGYYPATSAHPPFVHVDIRGTKARWKG